MTFDILINFTEQCFLLSSWQYCVQYIYFYVFIPGILTTLEVFGLFLLAMLFSIRHSMLDRAAFINILKTLCPDDIEEGCDDRFIVTS